MTYWVRFLVVGDTAYGGLWLRCAKNTELIRDKYYRTGYSLEVYEQFVEFEVFGYFLYPIIGMQRMSSLKQWAQVLYRLF